jgi:hypothetical protein
MAASTLAVSAGLNLPDLYCKASECRAEHRAAIEKRDGMKVLAALECEAADQFEEPKNVKACEVYLALVLLAPLLTTNGVNSSLLLFSCRYHVQ